MKSLISKSSCNFFLACWVGLALADGAQACSFNISHPNRYADCLINEAKDAGSNAGNAIANQLKSDARRSADQIIDTATKDANAIKSDAVKQADSIVAQAKSVTEKYYADSADIGPDLYEQLAATAEANYGGVNGFAMDIYQKSISKITQLDQMAVEALLREAGTKAISQNTDKLLSLHNAMTELDIEGQMALNRIIRAIPLGRINKQSLCDMPVLAKKLGLLVAETGEDIYSNNIPGDVKNSNFSICGVASAVEGGGVYASRCFAMNVRPTMQNNASRGYKMTIVQNVGIAGGIGADLGISLNWAPGTIVRNAVEVIGLQATVPSTPFGAGLSWDINPEHWEAIPGMSLSFGASTQISGSFSEGAAFPIGSIYFARDKNAN